ncbi:unnamed protein product [Rodentolepis nana]|uniref:PAS domain-containing protein n=1 Tax=Rodentolepis nana TaxID=102285 RepID=A0A0R3T7T8_RODNA|nr:unnamed protein product [Rodentolepis nana]
MLCSKIRGIADSNELLSTLRFYLTGKLVVAIESIMLEQNESLLPLTSALESLANTSKHMSYYTVNRMDLLQAMTIIATFEYLNEAVSTALHEVLVSGGSALEIVSNTSDTVTFCRVDSSGSKGGQDSCTSNTTSDLFAFFGDARESPQSDLLSLPIYSKLHGLNISDVGSKFRIKLKKLDDSGQFFWTMLPTSISQCNSSRSGEEALLGYALYMQSSKLSKLKSDAISRTKHMRLKASEINRL